MATLLSLYGADPTKRYGSKDILPENDVPNPQEKREASRWVGEYRTHYMATKVAGDENDLSTFFTRKKPAPGSARTSELRRWFWDAAVCIMGGRRRR
jgi:hypothetical protein